MSCYRELRAHLMVAPGVEKNRPSIVLIHGASLWWSLNRIVSIEPTAPPREWPVITNLSICSTISQFQGNDNLIHNYNMHAYIILSQNPLEAAVCHQGLIDNHSSLKKPLKYKMGSQVNNRIWCILTKHKQNWWSANNTLPTSAHPSPYLATMYTLGY